MEESSFDQDLGVLVTRLEGISQISVQEIVQILQGKGRFLLLIFFCLPFCQPIQIPGVAIPFGIMIAWMGLRFALNKKVMLPQKILQKKISAKKIRKIAHQGLKLVNRMRRFIHPRFQWLCQQKIMRASNGLFIFVLGIFLAIPFPIPLTNLIAAWSILLISLGLLEEDGIFVLLGYFVFVISLVLVFIIFLFLKK